MIDHQPHIVLDALLVNPKPTGVGRSILELTKALSVQPWGFKFTILVTAPELFLWLDDCPEWTVLFCPAACGGTLRKAVFTQFHMPRLCKKIKADILHSLQFVAPVFLPCASVVTVHDLAWLRFPETVEEPRKSYYRMMVPLTLKRATAVVTNSQATAVDVQHYYPEATSVSITPFGTPSWVWNQSRPENESVLPREFFLFVGTLEPRKNLEGILSAYSLMLEQKRISENSQWPSLVLVGGRGWKDSNLRKQMEPLLKSKDLLVLDYCEINKLRDLYLSAQALLFPSLHEGFGFPILEAMALGLPVITSSTGAMAEVAGTNALLVDPQKPEELCHQMVKLAESSDLQEKLSVAGPLWARKWTWGRTAEKTIKVYNTIVKSK